MRRRRATGDDHPVFNILRCSATSARSRKAALVYTDRIDGAAIEPRRRRRRAAACGRTSTAWLLQGALSRTEHDGDGDRRRRCGRRMFNRTGRRFGFRYTVARHRSRLPRRSRLHLAAAASPSRNVDAPAHRLRQARARCSSAGRATSSSTAPGSTTSSSAAARRRIASCTSTTTSRLRGGWRVGGSVLVRDVRLRPSALRRLRARRGRPPSGVEFDAVHRHAAAAEPRLRAVARPRRSAHGV